MGAGHFCLLDRAQEPVDAQRRRARLAGEHLELCDWQIAPGEAPVTALARYAECFVVPLAGTLMLSGSTDDGDDEAGPEQRPSHALQPGSLAYWAAARGPAVVRGAACRYLIVGWPHAVPPEPSVVARASPPHAVAPPATPGASGPAASAAAAPRSPATPPPVPGSPADAAPIPHRHGAWDVYRFDEALVPAAPGWRFFSVDGAYLTVGASYREALPPAREHPHSHDGEQINVAIEGRFAFTVGGHTETLTPGWAALTPRGVTHTGLHVELPYFQLIFATPPRGRDYAEFLRSIYRPRD
jgi:mannose-6-phosphate isomerase-like protein (cupin superfamily)